MFTSSPHRSLVVVGLLLVGACTEAKAKQAASPFDESKRQDLLTVYNVLQSTLSDEANLGKLALFKKLTLDAPNDSVTKLMEKLADSADAHADELEALREKAPAVTGKPGHVSAVGAAVQAIAKDFGKTEMMSREGGFDIRFVLVQAQATRMVSATAMALADNDPNQARKQWLRKLSKEFEGYRAELVAYAGGVPVKPR
jgi:hypothetical protein